MKRFLIRLLAAAAPRSAAALISARTRAHSHRVVESWGGHQVARKMFERFGNRVQEGPFAGLSLTPMTRAEQIGPYLLGVYESELDQAWAIVFRGTYTQVIDIGAKFGYYAVALAKRYPSASIVAFDTDWWARRAVREMAAANGANNVETKGFCSTRWLVSRTTEAALVISDCEGYESELFVPGVIARLRSATFIIETHDHAVSGVSDRLHSAFSETHSVHPFLQGGARRGTRHPLDFLTEDERQLAVHEVRDPNQRWLLCLPNTGPNRDIAR